MLKIEERTRWPVKDKSRLYFVVLRGSDKLYLRSETPEFAEEQKLELDLHYYLQKQFYKPMKKLLTYHPELFNFDDLFKKFERRLEMRDQHISEFTTGSTGHRRMLTAEDLAERAKKLKADGGNTGKRKTAMKDTLAVSGGSVFDRFLK